MYIEKFQDLANEIEKLRLEIYSKSYVSDEKDKNELDDLLFSIQSKLRYEVKDILDCYEIEFEITRT